MNVRVLSSLLALSLAVPLAVAERPARAQVSDADRNAARDLYNEGWSLQQAGRYADAVDRYQRSLAVFPAPTTAFRLAQCQEAIGKLVEAAEEFRAIVNAPLPQGSPPAFATAKQDAAVELAKLEPRIPKVKISVQPAGAAGLVVQVDGVNMPTALVGVARPIDPGSHTVTATAPGYAQAQAQFDVREKQATPDVALTLQQQATTYNPNGGATTYNPNGGTYQGQGGGYQGTSGYSPYNTWVPPRRHEEGPRNALMIGIDGALSIPWGNSGSGTGDLTSTLGAGGGGGIDVGLRLARILYVGALAQFSVFQNDSGSIGAGSAKTFALDLIVGLMSNPEGLGIYGEAGIGYRYLGLTVGSGDVSSGSADIVLGIGLQAKLGSFRFIPKLDLYIDPNDGGGAHGFFTLGIAGFWELPFGVRKAPAGPVNATPATTTTPAE